MRVRYNCKMSTRLCTVRAITAFAFLLVTSFPFPGTAEIQQGQPMAAQQAYDNNIQDLYELLLHHDALDSGHQLARKSVRSPSRRLRFGRRSDPNVPILSFADRSLQQPDDDIEDEFVPQKHIRAPVRLRFGRRSLEQAVPHIFPEPAMPNELYLRKDTRVPSMRLRFGRRSDPSMQFPIEQIAKDLKLTSTSDENEADD